jgi:methylamine dehydrogenase heavy chain
MRAHLVSMTLGFSLSCAALPRAQAEDLSTIAIPESTTVQVLPPAGPDRLYVLDMVFTHPIAGKAFVVDGIAQKVLGSITAGFLPSLVVAPGDKEILVLGTFWSRAARGERTDAVVFYDASTLAPIGEVKLPGRFLIADKAHNADLTTDGRYLLITNMTPATSVMVVDVKQRAVLGSIDTPGCTFVYPSGPRRFSSLCADGSLFTAQFDAEGKPTAQRSKAFFDVQNDPVFEHAGLDRRSSTAQFVSYLGHVFSVDLAAPTPVFGDPWSITSDAERKSGWRPGGWRLLDLHRDSHRLYVLMHRGGAWTHKYPGTEVWVLDVTTHLRVGRIKLKSPAQSIAVSQGQTPRLYAMADRDLLTYDIGSGELVGSLKDMGDTSLELITDDR